MTASELVAVPDSSLLRHFSHRLLAFETQPLDSHSDASCFLLPSRPRAPDSNRSGSSRLRGRPPLGPIRVAHDQVFHERKGLMETLGG